MTQTNLIYKETLMLHFSKTNICDLGGFASNTFIYCYKFRFFSILQVLSILSPIFVNCTLCIYTSWKKWKGPNRETEFLRSLMDSILFYFII